MWHAYFPNATIWGIEWPALDPRLVAVARGLERARVRGFEVGAEGFPNLRLHTDTKEIPNHSLSGV